MSKPFQSFAFILSIIVSCLLILPLISLFHILSILDNFPHNNFLQVKGADFNAAAVFAEQEAKKPGASYVNNMDPRVW
jgi:hypothetical protein